MKITHDLLIENEARFEFVTWLDKYFPEGADHEVIADKLREQKTTTDHAQWLYDTFKLSGECVEFWLNGQLHLRCTFKNGELHGLFEYWHPTGKLMGKCRYKNGKLIGLFD